MVGGECSGMRQGPGHDELCTICKGCEILYVRRDPSRSVEQREMRLIGNLPSRELSQSSQRKDG